MNPFAIAMVVLNLGAAIYEVWKHGAWKLGGMYVCYAIATLLMVLIGAEVAKHKVPA